MNTLRPDQETLEKLIALGNCADDERRIGDMLGLLKVNPYLCSIHGLQSFEWLCELSWTDACAVVKAVVRAEAARLTQSGGSVSAVKSAYSRREGQELTYANYFKSQSSVARILKAGLPGEIKRCARAALKA